jgi:hypothetical protein
MGMVSSPTEVTHFSRHNGRQIFPLLPASSTPAHSPARLIFLHFRPQTNRACQTRPASKFVQVNKRKMVANQSQDFCNLGTENDFPSSRTCPSPQSLTTCMWTEEIHGGARDSHSCLSAAMISVKITMVTDLQRSCPHLPVGYRTR